MGEDAYAQQFVPEPAPKPPVLRQIEALDERLSQPEPTAPAPQPLPVASPVPQAVIEHQPVVEAQPEPEPAPVPLPVTAKRPALGAAAAERVAREVAKKSKAAFTLRLDNDRHLRLRLASAVTNRSAQMLVTEALDAFLESIAEVEALARQVHPAANR
jgi:hypothetical protein